MATRVFRINPGESLDGNAAGVAGVTEAVGAATTKIVELTVDLNLTGLGGTRQITRDEVLEALIELEAYIQRVQWPPA